MGARFRYALQPILLTRQWDLDALLRDLGELNERVAQKQRAVALLREQMALASGEWNDLTQAAQPLSVARFSMLSHYLSDLGLQATAADAELLAAEQQRDDMIDRVVLSQRALEAVEGHRDEMKGRFVQARLSGDFKLADDQWNTLQARMTGDDN